MTTTTCPKCGWADPYIGFVKSECWNPDCENYTERHRKDVMEKRALERHAKYDDEDERESTPPMFGSWSGWIKLSDVDTQSLQAIASDQGHTADCSASEPTGGHPSGIVFGLDRTPAPVRLKGLKLYHVKPPMLSHSRVQGDPRVVGSLRFPMCSDCRTPLPTDTPQLTVEDYLAAAIVSSTRREWVTDYCARIQLNDCCRRAMQLRYLDKAAQCRRSAHTEDSAVQRS